ncbi:beta strand repeat-containing protein, partial [Bacteroidota bacterium]
MKNYAALNLNAVTIQYSVDGGTPVTYSSWTGPLAPNTVTAPFTVGSANFTVGSHNVTAWTEFPNNTSDENGNNDTASIDFWACIPLSGIYTIGGTSPDFADFSTAVTALNNCGVGGPVTFNVASGTYTEQVTLGQIGGASAINTVTFQSATGDSTDVTLAYASTLSTDNWTLKLDGADYITFRKMTIEATGGTYGRVIELAGGADYNTISNNVILMPHTTSSNFAGIYNYTSIDNYNYIGNNRIIGGYYGLYMYGPSSSSWEKGNKIINNDISGYYYYGILSYYQDSIEIIGNYIHDEDYGYSAIYAYYNFNGFNISNNKIIMSGSYASHYALRVYYCNYYSYAGTSATGLVYNNFVSVTSGTSTTYGLYAYYCDNVEYYFNSINLSSGSTSSRALYQYNTTSNSTGQTFMNNIFVNTAGGYAAYFSTTAALNNSNFNNFYTSGSYLTYWGGNRANLAAHQTASSMDGNSVSIMPSFYSSTDLHLYLAATDNQGTPIPNIMNDIDGDPRDPITPDIGADEYTPSPNDAGVVGITGLVPMCGGSLGADVKNFGTVSLSSVTINWSVNGVAQTPYNWTGSLAVGQTTNIIFGSYTFVTGNTYNIIISTSSPNGSADGNPGNDAITLNGLQPGISGTYTLNSALATGGTNFASFNDLATTLSTGICGPVTVNVVSGSGPYNEQVEFGVIPGTSSTNTVTINGNGETLSYNVPSSNYPLIGLNGTQHMTIDSLVIKSLSTTYGWGVWLANQADSNTIKNCTIDISLGTSSSSSYTWGIVASASKTSYASYGNNANYNTFMNNTILGNPNNYGLYGGIVINGEGSTNTGSVGNRIIGNTIQDFYYYGIRSYYNGGRQLIQGNDISRPNKPIVSYFYGIYSYYAGYNNIIEKNYLHNMFGGEPTGSDYAYSIYLYNSSTYTAPAWEYLVRNNIVAITNGNYYGYGMRSYYCDSIGIYNNTFAIDNPNATSTSTQYGMYVYYAYPADIQNNIISINRGGSATKYGIYLGTGSYNIDYNDVYLNPANLGTEYYGYSGGARSNLAAWQSVGYGANSMSVDPFYASVATEDFQPLNGALNNKGNDLYTSGMVTDDFYGNMRSTTPDIGAIEFTAPDGGTATASPDILCSGNTSTLTLTGYTPGSNLQWQVSSNGTSWTNASGTGAATATYTTPALTGDSIYRNLVTDPVSGGFTASVQDTVQVIGIPAISSFTPTSGGAGDMIDIIGTNFTGADSVKLNGIHVNYTVVSNTLITFDIPAGITTGKISVYTQCGSDITTTDFTIINGVTTYAIPEGTFFCSSTTDGDPVSVPFGSTGVFGGTNIYTAQLSDATGSFTSPVTIGSLASTSN